MYIKTEIKGGGLVLGGIAVLSLTAQRIIAIGMAEGADETLLKWAGTRSE